MVGPSASLDQHALREAALVQVQQHGVARIAFQRDAAAASARRAPCRQTRATSRARLLDAGGAGQEQGSGTADLHRLAQIGGRDLQRFAVLGHRAPRHLDAPAPRASRIWLSLSGLFASSAATSCLISARTAVLEALPPVSVFSGSRRSISARRCRRRGHVFGGGHARDGRFVQAQFVGDLAQHQRLHRDGAVVKKPSGARRWPARRAGWCRSAAGCSS